MRSVALFLFFFLIVGASTAIACSCIPIPTTKDHAKYMLEHNSAVFIGRVDGIRDMATPPDSILRSQSSVSVAVGEVFKGVDGLSKLEIVFSQMGCGKGFEEGDTYLIFAYRSDPEGALESNGCGLYKYLTTQPNEVKYSERMMSRVDDTLSLLRQVSQYHNSTESEVDQ